MTHIDYKTTMPGTAHPEWYKLGSQIGEFVNDIAMRHDIVGLVSPEAVSAAIACFKPLIAEVEINTLSAFGEHVTPDMVGDFTQRETHYEWPAQTGAVLHEAFHARFSRWNLDHAQKELAQDEYEALTLLEESRIEAWGIKSDPKHRLFLKSCTTDLVLGEVSVEQEKNSSAQLIKLVGLMHGRVIADVLDLSDVEEVIDDVNLALGIDVVEKLSTILRKFQKHDNHDNLEPVYDLAREWAQIARDVAKERNEDSGSGLSDAEKKILEGIMEKIQDSGEKISVRTYSELVDQEIQEEWKEEVETRASRSKEKLDNKKLADKVFSSGTGPMPESPTKSYLSESRKPNASERSAAVIVARMLEKAKYRERDLTEVSSVLPPGRLRTKTLVQASALKTKGVIETVEPWRKTVRKHTEDPNLTVGVLVDISGSMNSAMQPMATTAWVMSEAVRRVQGRTAMVYFGEDIFPTLKAGQHLTNVDVYTAYDGTEKFDKAFKALDGALNLINGSGARLLVVVSDGNYTDKETKAARRRISQCEQAGVAVLWLPFDSGGSAKRLLRESSVQPLTGVLDPAEAATEIGKAAASALTRVGAKVA